MDSESLRIPKKLQQVELWIHPEGRVLGSVYLHLHSAENPGHERPEEILNQPEPFLVLKCESPEELRFYSKRSIIRVEYKDEPPGNSAAQMTIGARAQMLDPAAESAGLVELDCHLHMMDGSVVTGVIRQFLLPGRQRLFDYINKTGDAFVKIHLADGDICLINKAYIVRVSAA